MTDLIKKSVQALHGYVPGEQPKDADVVKLNTNENPYPPSPRVAEALRAFDADRLRLYPDPVCSEVRACIADLHGCGPGNVFVGNGSDELLALCMRAFVERDGEIGFFDPSYSLYPILADIEEVAWKTTPLTADFGWVDPAPCPLFFLTNPNAPTSLAFPRERIEAFCASARGVVVIDEAYADFADENYLDLALSSDRVLVARTLSKSYSLAGIRLGYGVGPAPLIEALYKIKDSYNVDALSQTLALAALRDRPFFEETTRKILATRERVREALAERGWTVLPSATNFLWAKPDRISAKNLFEALTNRRMLVRFFPKEATREYLRITIGTDAEMDRFLETLDQIERES